MNVKEFKQPAAFQYKRTCFQWYQNATILSRFVASSYCSEAVQMLIFHHFSHSLHSSLYFANISSFYLSPSILPLSLTLLLCLLPISLTLLLCLFTYISHSTSMSFLPISLSTSMSFYLYLSLYFYVFLPISFTLLLCLFYLYLSLYFYVLFTYISHSTSVSILPSSLSLLPTSPSLSLNHLTHSLLT